MNAEMQTYLCSIWTSLRSTSREHAPFVVQAEAYGLRIFVVQRKGRSGLVSLKLTATMLGVTAQAP